MRRIRLMVIGLDSVPLRLVERFARAGRMPACAKLIRTGAACDILPVLPAYTPTNWATLCTGAWTGTHGAGNWNDRRVGDPASRCPRHTFDSRTITCETIFEAAERQGLVSLAVQYPGAWPSRTRKGLVVAPLPYGLSSLILARGAVYEVGAADRPELAARPASGWRAPVERGDREVEVTVELRRTVGEGFDSAAAAQAVGAHEDGAAVAVQRPGMKDRPDDRTAIRFWFLLPSVGEARQQVHVYLSKSDRRPAAKLTARGFSNWVRLEAPFAGGALPCAVRFRLARRSPDGQSAVIIRSEIYPGRHFTEPEELSEELFAEVGPFFEHTAVPPSDPALYDYCLEELDGQIDWIAKSAQRLRQARGYDIFYLHWHFPDSLLHAMLGAADPESPSYDSVAGPRALETIARGFERTDRLVRRLLALADERTVVAVVSDHGNAANKFAADLTARMAETGLLAPDQPDRSKVLLHGGWQLCVNLKGRDENGVVEPADYEKVQERIIDALLDWREPATGKRAVAWALKKRDAQVLGCWGPTIGDVVFTYSAGFAWVAPPPGRSIGVARGGANHGAQVPTARTALSSNLALGLFRGPGIRRGYKREGERWGFMRMVDVVPTLCHAIGLRPPRHSQGSVAYDLFEEKAPASASVP
jgi:predicted AlkP superfamily phosphohydrolase/phosphomutase